MSTKTQVLALLSESPGKYFSGQEIADLIGVTRASVWKAIKLLREEGYAIAASTNKGYAIAEGSDVLTPYAVESRITGGGYRVEVFPVLDSTNSEVRRRAAAGEAEGLVVISEEQTEGRGRNGRGFFSPRGTGLYMSVLLRPDAAAERSQLITSMAAVAAARAAENLCGGDVRIKWVNDLFLKDKKVCGILTEASLNLENNSLAYAVVGIGINVKEPAGGFPPEISDVAGAIFKNDDPRAAADTRCRLAADIINRFLGYCRNMKAKTFLREYKRRSMLMGRTVNVFDNVSGTSVPAFVLDIDDDCRLKVKFDDGTIKYLSSGEVSVRI